MSVRRLAGKLYRQLRPPGRALNLSAADLATSRRPDHYRGLIHRHVIDPWFPRCLDQEHGGFLCDFDNVWRPRGPHDKQLEFQARQTWAAAELLRAAPGDTRLQTAALHGFACLRDVMWDGRHGGWFTRVSRAGVPLDGGAKHVHGMAYAISACVAVHRAVAAPDALDLAREAFAWIDRHAHDPAHGGYFGPVHPDGAALVSTSEHPIEKGTDVIGAPLGCKDMNVHSDLIDTFDYLYEADGDPIVLARLKELVAILDRVTKAASGALPFLFAPDWAALPHLVRYGYGLQTAGRLLGAPMLKEHPQVPAMAKRLVDYHLRHAWDDRDGGFFYAAPSLPPYRLEDRDLIVRRKTWWVQVEGLKALAAVIQSVEDPEPYLPYFTAQRKYIERAFLDRRHGGLRPVGRAGLRPGIPGGARKGGGWKDASHEARAFLFCMKAAETG